MGDFTILNLRDLDDTMAHRSPGVEGRFARKLMESRDLGVTLWTYGPGKRLPFTHTHREQEEAFVVLSGSGRMLLDDAVRDVRQWDLVRVAPHVVRGFEGGPDGMELLAIGGPRPPGGDGEHTDGDWPV